MAGDPLIWPSGKNGPAYSVPIYDNGTESQVSWVVRRWDETDQEYYWWCICHRQAACVCVKAVKAQRKSIGLSDGREPGTRDT